jgi:hypothetical protein
VAKSWGQTGWADYSGVSRTLAGLTQAEAEQITGVLERISRPILAEEVMRALQISGRLTYDGDLTARPVSNTSTTYPGVAYGHMGDGLQLGYQAAMVSLHSPSMVAPGYRWPLTQGYGFLHPSRGADPNCRSQDRLASLATDGLAA